MAREKKAQAQGGFTPMMQQYLEVKEQHKDAILMYRLGDFYEMFFDDAKTVSRELELTLTGRDCGQAERAPMCGVPFHSAEGYIGRLVAKGYKVAICEQMEDPATAKGLVKREVIRMITPGTVMETSMLQEESNNFIAAVYMDSRGGGVCFCDVSTGECFATQTTAAEAGAELINELGRFSPAEVLLSQGAEQCKQLLDFAENRLDCFLVRSREHLFAAHSALDAAKTQFSAEPLPEGELLQLAAGALMQYLRENQKNDLAHIRKLEAYGRSQYMELDYTARRNLELTESLRTGEKRGSLLWVLDHTKTAMGARLLKQWLERPLRSVPQIQSRQNAVAELLEHDILRDELAADMSKIYDIERIVGRIVYGSANGRDLRALYQVCAQLPLLREKLRQMQAPLLCRLLEEMDDLSDIGELIDRSIVEEPPFSVREGGIIREGFDDQADRLRELLGGGTARLAEIERGERERTGIPKLKVGYNKVFGYYIEVTKSYTNQVPDTYIRKQTLTGCERYITPELKELEGEVLSASDRLTALEYQLFTQVREVIAGQVSRIQATSHAVAQLDALCSLAKAARKNHYVMPTVDDSDRLHIVAGRHPVVERVLEDSLFVPNDTHMDCGDNRVYVITGPNMAGKSTFMRQVALITVLAQIGSFVPANEAHIGVCDRVFTRVGASDDLFAGRSTFMVEMNEVAEILKYATNRSLLILDEIGRGTSTFDGMSIARAVLEYVADKKHLGAKTLFATHYHELCALEGIVDGVKNYNIVVKKRGEDIIFIKKIVPGGANDSYGIEVAKLAGLPDKVVKRARAVLAEIERKPSVLPVSAATPEATAEEPEELQLSLGSMAGSELVERLRKLEPEVLTPIEAMNLLYELHKQAQDC